MRGTSLTWRDLIFSRRIFVHLLKRYLTEDWYRLRRVYLFNNGTTIRQQLLANHLLDYDNYYASNFSRFDLNKHAWEQHFIPTPHTGLERAQRFFFSCFFFLFPFFSLFSSLKMEIALFTAISCLVLNLRYVFFCILALKLFDRKTENTVLINVCNEFETCLFRARVSFFRCAIESLQEGLSLRPSVGPTAAKTQPCHKVCSSVCPPVLYNLLFFCEFQSVIMTKWTLSDASYEPAWFLYPQKRPYSLSENKIKWDTWTDRRTDGHNR